MKHKVLYYTFLILTTVITLCLFKLPMETWKQPFVKQTQKFISNQQVSPKRLYVNAWRNIKNQYYDPKMNGQDWSRWKTRYLEHIETEEDANVAINTMLQSLDDPYSKFMAMPEYETQNNVIESNISGIGINVVSIAGKLFISNVLEDSPAQASNLMVGDIIEEINGIDINNFPIEEAVKLIRGEKNTYIELKIKRNKKYFRKRIKREVVRLKNVHVKILDSNIGYIQVASFMGVYVPQEFEDAIKKTQNTKGIIIDLRGDAGGLLNNAVLVANMIIKKGNIVSITYRNGLKIDMPAQNTVIFKEKPIVILINRGTASASEILTGALRDNKNAILVGDRSYGKNSIQQIITMPNHTGMNLTIAKYMMPNGEDIHNKGIKPDYYIPFTKQDHKKNKDPQLLKAEEIIKFAKAKTSK